MMPRDKSDGLDSGFTSWLVDEHAAIVFDDMPPSEGEEATPSDADDDPLRKQAQAGLKALEQLRRGDWVEPVPNASTGTAEGTVDASGDVARLDRFEIREELGRGGHGIVYRAFDPSLNREVALKLPRVEAVFSPKMRQRLLREARAVASLSHPNLLPIFDVGESGPTYCIASEYCSGPTLSQWLKQQPQSINPLLAAKIIAPLTDAVSLVHRHGILHRDLKPSNILLFESQRSKADGLEATGEEEFPYVPKLTDFGLAKLNDGLEMTKTGALVGTPAYMSPEQAEGRNKDVDVRTDIYSLGVMLYELLTGEPPFSGASDLAILRQVSDGVFPNPARFDEASPANWKRSA